MATWTTLRLVKNVYEAHDGNVAWVGAESLEDPGGSANVSPGVGQVSNRLVMWGMAATFPELTTSHRLRRIYIQFDIADKTSSDANIVRVYWLTSKAQIGQPGVWPSYSFRSFDESIGSWGFPTNNDGQLAMQYLLEALRYLKIIVEHDGADVARLFLKGLSMKVQYDDPPPPPPDNRAGLLLGM